MFSLFNGNCTFTLGKIRFNFKCKLFFGFCFNHAFTVFGVIFSAYNRNFFAAEIEVFNSAVFIG